MPGCASADLGQPFDSAAGDAVPLPDFDWQAGWAATHQGLYAALTKELVSVMVDAAAARSGAEEGCSVTVSSFAECSAAVLGSAEESSELQAGASWLAATETIQGYQAELLSQHRRDLTGMILS